MEKAHRLKKFQLAHIKILHQYVTFCVQEKIVRSTLFHHKCKPYSRKQSTIDLINRAKKAKIIFEPQLLCIPDIDVEFYEYKTAPLIDLFEKKKNDPKVTYTMTLAGFYSLICFRYGKRSLTYVKCIIPSIPAKKHFNDIDLTVYNKESLPEMRKPEKWDALDWKIYKERKYPTASSVKIGQKLGVTYVTVLNRYKKILKDCQIWIPFFPNGYKKYAQYVVTLKTAYETGLVKELKKLDRSSYVYKAGDTLILSLFFDRHLEIEKFLYLEKLGMIHDVRISFPLRYSNVFEY